tara:strand:- start:1829 stop:2257 length:429 start_codon:yes stop_codon:yes gene_type:complete
VSEFSISSPDFNEGAEIPKKFGYKFENQQPQIDFKNIPEGTKTIALVMDDPDAMSAVGKVWVHWLEYHDVNDITTTIQGKTDFGEIGYGGPAPPDKRHTYIFKAYALNMELDLKEGYSKKELEDAINSNIISKAKLTGTFTP